MTVTNKIRVHIELNGLSQIVEGDSDQVIQEVITFISRICPTFDIASRLVWSPDYSKMLDSISYLTQISPSGEILMKESVSSADQAIGLVLMCAHITNRFGKKTNEEMSVEEISAATKKAVKTIRNTLVEMLKAGLVERTGRGTYKISANGLEEVHEAAKELTENQIVETRQLDKS